MDVNVLPSINKGSFLSFPIRDPMRKYNDTNRIYALTDLLFSV